MFLLLLLLVFVFGCCCVCGVFSPLSVFVVCVLVPFFGVFVCASASVDQSVSCSSHFRNTHFEKVTKPEAAAFLYLCHKPCFFFWGLVVVVCSSLRARTKRQWRRRENGTYKGEEKTFWRGFFFFLFCLGAFFTVFWGFVLCWVRLEDCNGLHGVSVRSTVVIVVGLCDVLCFVNPFSFRVCCCVSSSFACGGCLMCRAWSGAMD